MSLTLRSSNKALTALITSLLEDKKVTSEELEKLRTQATQQMAKLEMPDDQFALEFAYFNSRVDDITAQFPVMAAEVERNQPSAKDLKSVQEAVEYQLAYILLAYQASLIDGFAKK